MSYEIRFRKEAEMDLADAAYGSSGTQWTCDRVESVTEDKANADEAPGCFAMLRARGQVCKCH